MGEDDHQLKKPMRPDPTCDRDQFVYALKFLVRIQAKIPGRTLASAAKVTDSTVTRYLLGQTFPTQDFVEAVVPVALHRLNLNAAYVTVDVDRELRNWQVAWVHAEKTPPTSTPSPSPDDEAAPEEPVRQGWRKLTAPLVAAGGVIAAFAGARMGATAGHASFPTSAGYGGQVGQSEPAVNTLEPHDPDSSPSTRPLQGRAPSSPAPTGRETPEPSTPATQTPEPHEDDSASPQPQVWKPTPLHPGKSRDMGTATSPSSSARPTRRRIWTYSEHVRKYGK